jgi:hypothetical protein
MKRFLIFALFYPLLTIIILLLVSLTHIGVAALSYTVPLVAWSYAIGVLPAIALAFVDWFLAARLGALRRIASVALVALLMGILFTLSTSDSSAWFDRLIFGLANAIPAAICSWLSGEKQNGGKA